MWGANVNTTANGEEDHGDVPIICSFFDKKLYKLIYSFIRAALK
jgi:hypothetical protein